MGTYPVYDRVITLSHKKTEQKLTGEVIPAGGSKDIDITLPFGKTRMAITLKATYNPSATTGVRLDVLYSPDGVNYDTDTDDTYTHPFTAGQTKQKTYIVTIIHPYVKLRVVNLDTTYDVTVDLWVTYV